MAVTGWRGVGLELSGASQLVDAVLDHLPDFYDDRQQRTCAARVLEGSGGFHLELEGAAGPLQARPQHSLADIANLVELAVVERLPGLVALHAGAVVHDGQALLFPGSTRSGKSHLVSTLLRLGAAYLSDEIVLLDAEGRAHAYPRSLSLREAGALRRVSATDLGADTWSEPVAVRAVALLHYDETMASMDLEALAPGDLWRLAMEHCISAHRQPAAAFTSITALARTATGLRGRRGHAENMTPSLLRALNGDR